MVIGAGIFHIFPVLIYKTLQSKERINMDKKDRIGFIGTGIMGRNMASHLMDAGHKLGVYSRTKEKSKPLLEKGAEWFGTAAELAGSSGIIFTMVGFPADVREIYLGEKGIVANARKGSCLVDMTTSSPVLAEEIYGAAAKKGIFALDAPVSGGETGAKNATLSIMVGGDREAYERILPLFGLLGRNIVYQGKSGSGQNTKMCNQIAIASGMLGVCEAMIYAMRSGLDPETVLKSIESGAAGSWSLSNYGPKMIKGNFDPGFYVKHFIKDMKIASETAKSMKIRTPGLDLALSLYEELAKNGGENLGTQGLFKIYKK
jgi:3-hydroxyisobutyrate dehydrogenase